MYYEKDFNSRYGIDDDNDGKADCDDTDCAADAKCAVEICSLSKTAGFTGTRCGYTIVPEELMLKTPAGEDISFYQLWTRRQGSKFNGVSYPVQRAAEAVYSEDGKMQVKDTIDYYMTNAKIIRNGLEAAGYTVFGGKNSPYVWAKTPDGMDSWTFFDYLLKEKNIVATPGVGFGVSGEGYIRFSALGDKDATIEAMKRLG